jgi:hypothetical protein
MTRSKPTAALWHAGEALLEVAVNGFLIGRAAAGRTLLRVSLTAASLGGLGVLLAAGFGQEEGAGGGDAGSFGRMIVILSSR